MNPKTPIATAAHKRRTSQIALVICLVVFAAGLTGLFAWRQADHQADEDQTKKISALERRADRAQQQAEALANQVVSLGEEPVVQPSPADPVTPTISQAQADAAFAAYCSVNPDRCKGKDLTAADALVALNNYCDVNGCEATQKDILQAVVSACRSGSVDCRGPEGAKGDTGEPGLPGEPGANGEPGVSITDVTCAADGFSFVLSDGSTVGPLGDCVAEQGPQGEQGPKGDPGVVSVAADETCSTILPGVSISLSLEGDTLTLHCSYGRD